MKTKEIVSEIPEGWRVLEGASTAPVGYKWISNGKSMFGGEYKNALLKLKPNQTSLS